MLYEERGVNTAYYMETDHRWNTYVYDLHNYWTFWDNYGIPLMVRWERDNRRTSYRFMKSEETQNEKDCNV